MFNKVSNIKKEKERKMKKKRKNNFKMLSEK